MLSAIVCIPKRHFLTSQLVFWAIVRQNSSTGHFSRRVREKNKNKNRPYISRISKFRLTADWHKFWVMCSSRGRNLYYCAKFYCYRLRVWLLWMVGVWPFHWIAMLSLTQGGTAVRLWLINANWVVEEYYINDSVHRPSMLPVRTLSTGYNCAFDLSTFLKTVNCDFD